MDIKHKVIREGCHVKLAITVDGIDCGNHLIAGTTDPSQQHFLDALVEGRMSLKDFEKAIFRGSSR